ncbi:MAG: DUF512 domain-containing protein [Chloroflexi bacterium]|nr:DUF512 domain-containing protein [Chloroflexota bacterium]
MSAGGLIVAVEPGSVGEEVGLEPGDRLVSVNGHPLRDLVDYHFYTAEEELELVVERGGVRYRLEIERDYDESLGLEFDGIVFDGLRQCNNRCPFCFVQQMPRPSDLPSGRPLRASLYLRDDDYRYSFLQGNFITLTNLTEEDWQRIGEQRLSPLYVSIHATDDAVRRHILGNPQAPAILPQLQRLAEMDIQVHGQIVLWPGVNDGETLRRSIVELFALWPTVQTLALVPVGLTRYCRGPLRLLRPDEAAEVLALADSWRPRLKRRLHKTWLYPSDELYLLAGRPLPEAAFYDDPAQLENGVGLVRRLLDDWARAKTKLRPGRFAAHKALLSGITLVCGTLIAPIMAGIAAEFERLAGFPVRLVVVTNHLLGETVTVSGLLAGKDVIEALRGLELGQRVFIPRSMLDASGQVTLDDMTVPTLSQELGVPVSPASLMSEVVTACRPETIHAKLGHINKGKGGGKEKR